MLLTSVFQNYAQGKVLCIYQIYLSTLYENSYLILFSLVNLIVDDINIIFLVIFKVDVNIIILCNQNTSINKVLKNKQRIVLRQM